MEAGLCSRLAVSGRELHSVTEFLSKSYGEGGSRPERKAKVVTG